MADLKDKITKKKQELKEIDDLIAEQDKMINDPDMESVKADAIEAKEDL